MDGPNSSGKYLAAATSGHWNLIVVDKPYPESTDGRREDSGSEVRELQGRWPGSIGVDGRSADGLQPPRGGAMAVCGMAREYAAGNSRGPGWREFAGTLGQLQAGRQAGSGMARSRARVQLNFPA